MCEGSGVPRRGVATVKAAKYMFLERRCQVHLPATLTGQGNGAAAEAIVENAGGGQVHIRRAYLAVQTQPCIRTHLQIAGGGDIAQLHAVGAADTCRGGIDIHPPTKVVTGLPQLDVAVGLELAGAGNPQGCGLLDGAH